MIEKKPLQLALAGLALSGMMQMAQAAQAGPSVERPQLPVAYYPNGDCAACYDCRPADDPGCVPPWFSPYG